MSPPRLVVDVLSLSMPVLHTCQKLVSPQHMFFLPRAGQRTLESMRTGRRPHPRTIALWKNQLLDECRFFAMDVVAARISGRTVDEDLSPHCRIIAHEERTGSGGSLVNLFEASVKRKDAADLQLSPLLLSKDRARVSQDQMLAGDFAHSKEALNVQLGGILLALEQDPMVAGCVVVAGGAVVSALTGCSAGAPTLSFRMPIVVHPFLLLLHYL